MAQFAFLLNHAPDRYAGLSEDEYMHIIKDYIAWVEKATADGIYKGGHKLASEAGKQVRSNGSGVEVHDSPFTELSEVLGGLMIVEVADMEAAIDLARTHPHLKHNTQLEIRQVDGVE